jgi:hypothetical protein
MRNLLDVRIAERHDAAFNPKELSYLLNGVYKDVENRADEYGRLEPKQVNAL